jgi:DNA (cytosine-5)-methyltransferase 1
MKMLSLFSGIGGIDLAAQWAGIETVAFCEIEPFCQKVLKKHWPDVPIFDDVKKLTKEVLDNAGITGIDIVAGGYPCQPFSTSGNRKGAADDRYLWPEMFRIISEIRPTWVIGENVGGHISLGIDAVFDDLENINYESQAFVLPACAVDAWHRRDRVFIVANSDRVRCDLWGYQGQGIQRENETFYEINSGIKTTSYTNGSRELQSQRCIRTFGKRIGDSFRWESEPGLARVVYGLSGGVDRTAALGRTVVPQQIYPILAAIAEIEDNSRREEEGEG